jgi:hypothetical protein
MAQAGVWWGLAASFALAATLAVSHGLLRSAALLDTGLWSPAYLWRVGGALALYGLVFAVYTYLLRWFELSLLYPFTPGCPWFSYSSPASGSSRNR